MGKFFTHKKNAQDLNDSIRERRKVSDKIDSLSIYNKVVTSDAPCYYDSSKLEDILIALEKGLYTATYPVAFSCPATSNNIQLEEYIRLYETSGNYRYFILICELLNKQLSKLVSKIRYLYKKLTTNYRIDLFKFIKNIIRKLLKSLDDDTDSSVIKSYNIFLNQKLSFYKILIPVHNEKETKERIYKRIK